MKILKLTTRKFRGLPDGEYSFADRTSGAPLDVVLVTGAARSGTTSLLEAIIAAKEAAGAYGLTPLPAQCLRHGATDGLVEATWLLSARERSAAGLEDPTLVTRWPMHPGVGHEPSPPRVREVFAAYDHDASHGKMEYFAANRQLIFNGARPTDRDEKRLRLTRATDKYAGVARLFETLALQDSADLAETIASQGIALRNTVPDSLAPLRRAMAELCPDRRLAGVDLRKGRAEVLFAREDGSTVLLEELSASEQQAVLVAATYERIGLHHSIVLIDEPELHQHPTVRAQWFQALLGLGRDNQVIAATTSTEILACVPAQAVINLSSR